MSLYMYIINRKMSLKYRESKKLEIIYFYKTRNFEIICIFLIVNEDKTATQKGTQNW